MVVYMKQIRMESKITLIFFMEGAMKLFKKLIVAWKNLQEDQKTLVITLTMAITMAIVFAGIPLMVFGYMLFVKAWEISSLAFISLVVGFLVFMASKA